MSFRKLDIWNKSIILTNDIYNITRNFPKIEIYGLTQQMQRAAVSVPSNISEGYRRNSKKEFSVFLGYARGSAGELESQIEIAFMQKYINEQQKNNLIDACDELSRMIWSFKQSLK